MSSTPSTASHEGGRWLYWGAWVLAIGLMLFAGYLGWRVSSARAEVPNQAVSTQEVVTKSINLALPQLKSNVDLQAIPRHTKLHTTIPSRPREDVLDYMVVAGDSVFGLARSFGIKPESILWSNYDTLNDNPDQLSPGIELKIPPVDGVLYQWKEGDTVQGVAEQFKTDPEAILGWSGNKLDLTDPEIEPGRYVMVPGGEREFRQWLVPTIPRGRAGVSSSLYGAGACSDGYEGAYGTGGFVWPADNHTLSGNDYWSGHLGIDIAAGLGAAVYAADSGVVVFAGGAFGGYGNMVMIDHGNGYQTLYAHLNSVGISCGSSVSQGQYIGSAGSSGNSTGAHLHFEVRYLGGFVSPWFVLPAP